MITLNIDIDNESFEEASSVLDSFGMTIDIALKLFINNIIKTKGFPIELKQKDVQETPTIKIDKGKSRINEDMIEVVWEKFKMLLKEELSVNALSAKIQSESGMNKGSAFIYLTILTNMVQGKENTRNMKVKDFKFFLKKIKNELGQETIQKSLQSLNLSLISWSKDPILKNYAISVKNLVDSYQH